MDLLWKYTFEIQVLSQLEMDCFYHSLVRSFISCFSMNRSLKILKFLGISHEHCQDFQSLLQNNGQDDNFSNFLG